MVPVSAKEQITEQLSPDAAVIEQITEELLPDAVTKEQSTGELLPDAVTKEQSTGELLPDAVTKEQSTGELSLELEAKTAVPDKKQIEDDMLITKDIIDYANVFGSNTTLRYTPTFSGFKEDIIIDSYNGINEFTFRINTNGLSLVNEYEQYFLVDPLTGEYAVSLGDLFVYDSSVSDPEVITEEYEPPVYNHSYDVQEIIPNEEYLITIIVDSEYLVSEDTVYPVIVDPSFQILSGSLMDISVRQDGVVTRNNYCTVGVSYSDNKVNRTFIKFPGLLSNSLFQSLAPYGYGYGIYPEITNITLTMYSIGVGYAGSTGNVYLYTGSDWTASTSSFTSTNFNALGTKIGSTSLPYNSAWVNFDLTSIGYHNSLGQADKGIVIKNIYEGSSDSAVVKELYSTRASSNKPYITVTYTGPTTNTTFASAKSISLNSYAIVSVTAGSQKRYYAFTAPTTGFYTFESSDNGSCDPYGWLYNSGQAELDKNDDGAGSRNFRITYRLDSGQTYYIAAGCYSTGTGSYSLKISANTSLSNLSATTISTTMTGSASITASRQRRYFVFTAPATGSYVFMSFNNGSSDPYGWLYNSDASLLSSNDDGKGNRDFLISANLTAGQKVYLVAGCYNTGTGSYSISAKQKHAATIYDYYDYSWSLKAGSDTSAKAIIETYRSCINDIFSVNFGLIVTKNTITKFESFGDLCHGSGANVTLANIQNPCPHSIYIKWPDKIGHKTAENINNYLINYLYNQNSPNPPNKCVMMTAYCNGIAEAVGGRGATVGFASSASDLYIIYQYIHELGHCFGARGDNNCPALQPCIMSYYTGWPDTYQLIEENDPTKYFCDQCKSEIMNHIIEKGY